MQVENSVILEVFIFQLSIIYLTCNEIFLSRVLKTFLFFLFSTEMGVEASNLFVLLLDWSVYTKHFVKILNLFIDIFRAIWSIDFKFGIWITQMLKWSSRKFGGYVRQFVRRIPISCDHNISKTVWHK